MKRKYKLFTIVLLTLIGTASLFAKSNAKWEAYAKDLRTPSKQVSLKKPTILQKQKSEYSGWHIQTKVKFTTPDGTKYDQGNTGVFGELKQSKNQKDSQDVLSVDLNTVQVIFPKYDWHSDKGDYSSDYRHWRKSKETEKEVWTFQVKIPADSKLKKASFTISLDGIYDINSTLKDHKMMYTETAHRPDRSKIFNLVDVDKQVMYFSNELKDVNFSMNGLHTRTFRWIKNGLADDKDYEKITPEMSEETVKERTSSMQKQPGTDSSTEDETPKDFIPAVPREPGDPFGPPPSF